jgi:alkyl hydroperoxide reductase subunit AhpF
MINYTWNCKTVDVYVSEGGNENVIYNVHWHLTGEDSETAVRGECIGTHVLDISDIENFINFEDVTHEKVIEWIEASKGSEVIDRLKQNIADQIAEHTNPISVTMEIGGQAIETTTEN